MKLFIKAACLAFVLTVIYTLIPFQAQCKNISDDVFRLHIVANSDSEADQALKLRVRDRVLEYTGELFDSASSKEEAEIFTAANLKEIENISKKEIKSSGYDYPVKAEIKNMYFNTRHYDSYTLPSGMYDALRITIGSGNGHNWWCVMYPSICLSAAVDQDERAREALDEGEYDVVKNEKYQYKFKVVEIFEYLCSCLEPSN